MAKDSVRLADKNTQFICQITESSVRVLKCQSWRFTQKKFLDLEISNFSYGADNKLIAEKIKETFKKLGFNNNPVTVCLPRSSVTARYLKVPSRTPEEIENMILLQAPRFLPYPVTELITGFECIHTDKEGFTHLNLIIAHKGIVERFTNLFRALKIKDFTLTLSSYGLANLYGFLQPQEQGPVILIDLEHPFVELAIVAGEKLIFSRAFKISEMDWQNNLITQLDKTMQAYLKDRPFKEPLKIVIPDHPRLSQKIEELLSTHTSLAVTRLSYQEKIPAIPTFRKKTAQVQNSLAILIGLGLKKVPETLNLLPKEKKEQIKKQTKLIENTKFAMLVFGLIVMLTLGLRQSLINKELYLKELKNQMNKIGKNAAGIAELERRYQLLDKRKNEASVSLELISQLHKVIPQEISLSNFSFEEERQLTLRGQAPAPGIVFEFVKKLETAEAFKSFSIKIRYVTQKRTQSGEVADFEIVCSKEK